MTDTISSQTMIIDAAVHPMVHYKGDQSGGWLPSSDELRRYLEEPWRSSPIPPPSRYFYPAPTGEAPFGEYRESARVGDELPCADPDTLKHFMTNMGVSKVVLLPLTRGLIPDMDLSNVVCSATNAWLADAWLDTDADGVYFGSIRVNPGDPDAAVREIEKWSRHARMVQVAIPLEAHSPYGQRNYFRIWEAAASNGLPVAVHSDGGAGTDFYPAANGYPRHFIEYNSMFSVNFICHLVSLIAEGVFERLPTLKFVFADGGHDMLMPLMWRMDMDWPISGVRLPWVKRRPSEYLKSNVRFCTASLEGPIAGPRAPEVDDDWLAISDAGNLLMFSSNYPHWTSQTPQEFASFIPAAIQQRLLSNNALEWYGARLTPPAGPTVAVTGRDD